jgi:hypothetical protein
MEMPQLSPGHKKFEDLAGEWKGNETMYPSHWDPKGGVAKGKTTSRVAVGGFALVSDYLQERDGVITFQGHGVYSYDPRSELYTLYWVDSIGSPPEVFTGKFEGNVLTLGHEGQPMRVRLIYDLSKPGFMASSMEMSQNGVEWKKLFDAEYQRS